jgi:hypothetical protein
MTTTTAEGTRKTRRTRTDVSPARPAVRG